MADLRLRRRRGLLRRAHCRGERADLELHRAHQDACRAQGARCAGHAHPRRRARTGVGVWGPRWTQRPQSAAPAPARRPQRGKEPPAEYSLADHIKRGALSAGWGGPKVMREDDPDFPEVYKMTSHSKQAFPHHSPDRVARFRGEAVKSVLTMPTKPV
ncbi:unnamed protein product [Prorocentrum cordatum]|uniref:Uncharacterized protein n=1 Tax=Prorocentrum cordatum TaxID=2364126 RepID=A0ABN9X7V7_9DINO|nr:unnamed protein product [Polarella glacialis]